MAGWLTDAQYGSSAGMTLSSESLKMPFLNTSFESEAPILNCANHQGLCVCCGGEGGVGVRSWRASSSGCLSVDLIVSDLITT